MIYWFTGQPGSGKTTLANLLKNNLNKRNKIVFHIDGDILRKFTFNKKYDLDSRMKNVKRAYLISKFLHFFGFTVIVSMVSPFVRYRNYITKYKNCKLFYLHTNRKTYKDKYKVKNYKIPLCDCVNINTDLDINECLNKILKEVH